MRVLVALVVGIGIGAVAVAVVRALKQPGQARSRKPENRASLADSPAERVLRLLPSAVVLLDASGNVRLSNAAANAMGVTRASRLDVPELVQLARRVRRTGQAETAEVALTASAHGPRLFLAAVRAEPLRDGDVVLIVEDLTEAKRLEAVRRDFVSNVGHEIKTPVAAISVLVEAAVEAGDDRAFVDRFLSRIQHESQRLSRLVQDLLDLSRIQGGEPLPSGTDVLVDAVVEEAIDRVRSAAATKDISIQRGGDIGLVVRGEEQQLVTALCNLLDNAVAYSQAGTSVAVGVRLRDGDVEIVVKDEGIGIAAADQERIFERFYRVDPARSRETGGTGLGLAIVKNIVNNHGGDVTVWSEAEAGSTFTVRLPSAGTPEAADLAAPDRESQPS